MKQMSIVSYGTTEFSKDSNVWTVLTNHIWVTKPDKLVYSFYVYTILLHFIVLWSYHQFKQINVIDVS